MNFNTIRASEIETGDIVKVLVCEDDVNEENYAVVRMNTGNVLGLHYLSPTTKLYKSATVYEVDDDSETIQPAPFESLLEHYPSGTTFADLEFKSLGENRYALLESIDQEDSCSSLWSEGSDSDSDLSFITDDGDGEAEIGGIDLPPGHKEIDAAWDAWEPGTSGGRSFKDTVDSIEAAIRARHSNHI